MKIIYQTEYKKNGNNIQEIKIRDVSKKEAREIRQRLLQKYSKVEMCPFEVYEDRPRASNFPVDCYKGYIFYIWLPSYI